MVFLYHGAGRTRLKKEPPEAQGGKKTERGKDEKGFERGKREDTL